MKRGEGLPAIRHITQRAAFSFVTAHHRHHKAPQGAIICLGMHDEAGALVAVAILGRPVACMLDNGENIELIRLCALPEARNACSSLIAKARRLAQALGYARMITYTLPAEGGASLRASGAVLDGEAGGGEWTRRKRQRKPSSNPERKLRWSSDTGLEPTKKTPPGT